MFGHSSAPTFSATASGKTTARSSTLASTPGIPSCNCPTVSHPSPGALGPDMSPDEAAGMIVRIEPIADLDGCRLRRRGFREPVVDCVLDEESCWRYAHL